MSKILYAGDSSLNGAASYLAGVMTHYGLRFDYVPSGKRLSDTLAHGEHGLYILSDYPSANLRAADGRKILESVRAGAGLLMIGGWESFHGLGGDWDRCALAAALPVRISSTDDRVNSSEPVVVQKVSEHPIVRGLPFRAPPHVGGYNRLRAKAGATTILMGQHLVVKAGADGSLLTAAGRSAPMLVVGQFGRGRTAAFASDAAPHWVGGLVDWGAKRISAQAKGGGSVEVGNHYAELFARLVRWTMGEL